MGPTGLIKIKLSPLGLGQKSGPSDSGSTSYSVKSPSPTFGLGPTHKMM
jgi:hypothetical protein